jgi:hypothetical protein
MTGEGVFAQLIQKRYRLAMQKLNYPGTEDLDTTLFRPATAAQMALF